MNKKLRIGIVGCGRHMFEFLYTCLRFTDPVSVVAACDINEDKLNKFTSYYHIPNTYTDFREMIEKEALDAIVCVINEQMHYEVAKTAMLAGVNVFVEKTPCLNSQQAEELVKIQEQTGKTTMVGFNRRFMTSYAMAKEITQRPEFGMIRMYQSQFNGTPYKSEAYYKFNHIIHHLDLARFLMGEIKLTHVERTYLDDNRVGFAISFRSPEGGIGTIQSGSFLDEYYPMERLELIGDRRNIVVDNVKNLEYNRPPERKDQYKPYTLKDGGDTLKWNQSHGYYPRFSHHGYENELHYFVDCLMNDKKPEPNFEDSVKTMRLLEDLEALLKAKA
jgi:predicted dehydrogenase